MNEFLEDIPCADCARLCPAVGLQFDHHPDSDEKEHTIADLMSRAATRENRLKVT